MGTRRTKDNVRSRVIATVLKRANELRAARKQPPIHVHLTPHTFRRTYATYLLAAGHDVPYVQHQLGHVDPTTTLAIYAQLIRRPDRDQLRVEHRNFIDSPINDTGHVAPATQVPASHAAPPAIHASAHIDGLRRVEKAGKGRATTL